MRKKVLSVLALIMALASFGFANQSIEFQEAIFDREGHKLPDADVNSPRVNWQLLKFEDSHGYSGIGFLDLGGGGCSATLLDTGATGNAPAYILTNGHCAGGAQLLGPEEIAVDRPAPEGMNVRFNYFVNAGSKIRRVDVRRIVYATMKNTDIAVLELDIPFLELAREGFIPHAIASEDPRPGTPVEMVGIPQSGVRRATRFIRRSTCEIGGRAHLREGDYHFSSAFRHGCSSVGGSSGTSMISLEDGKIVAINNTGVSDRAMDSPECAMDRPCEVSTTGEVRTNLNTNYAQKVTNIPSCFDKDGVFDLGLPHCKLERRGGEGQ